MIRLQRHIVDKGGGGPDGSDAQFGKVVKMVRHALQVAAVTRQGNLGVRLLLLPHPCNVVVRRVTIGKAVRHQQIDDVAGIIRLALHCLALLQFVGNACFAHHNVEPLCGSPFRIKIKNNIVGVGHQLGFAQCNPIGPLQGHRLLGYVPPV